MVTTPMGRYSTFIRFLIAFFLLVLLIIIGTLGYRFIEGWSIRDSLYMTFITMTTVGFGEVKPLSSAGQHFTIVFLVLSIGTVGYSVTVLITYVFEGQILNVMKERRMKRTIRHLKNHFIIVGGGDVGREAAYAFGRSKKRFVVVDRNPSQSDLSRDESILFIEGDAINDEILVEAGIERASGLISALPDDEANVFVVLTARQLNPHLLIVSQAAEERTTGKLIKAGANRVIVGVRITPHRQNPQRGGDRPAHRGDRRGHQCPGGAGADQPIDNLDPVLSETRCGRRADRPWKRGSAHAIAGVRAQGSLISLYSVQSKTTLPDIPARITSKPFSYSV